MRTCADCGADISRRHGNSRLCEPCAAARATLTQRNRPVRQRAPRGHVRPRKACRGCGDQFTPKRVDSDVCSVACKNWSRAHPDMLAPPTTGRFCEMCKSEVPSNLRRSTRYCSTSCRSAASKRRKGVGTPFIRYLYCAHCGSVLIGKKAGTKYCSEDCLNREYRSPSSYVIRSSPGFCEHCGEIIPAAGRYDRRFCSDRCTVRSNQAIRRARRKGLPAEKFSRFEVFERDRWMCHICRAPVVHDLSAYGPLSPTVDHLIPLSHPATPGHVKTNVALAHRRCNISKNGRVRPRDFGLRIELLIKEVERLGAERRLAS